MSEGDRPADAAPRVISLRDRVARRRTAPLLAPGEIARRLAALEHQVETALGAERPGGFVTIERAVENALAAYLAGRRWIAREAGGLATTLLGDLSLAAFHRWWWRIDVVGRERLPAGPVLLVANRGSSLLPYDALMTSVALGADGGRRTWPFVDDWLLGLPVVGSALAGLGARAASAPAVRRTLEAGDTALVFPEGRESVARPYREAYRVARFARTALLRVAIETRAPIVPIGIIGVDEVHPVVARLPLPKVPGLLGIPALPLTPTLVPLPTKWTLFVGDPLDVAARYGPADARNPAAVRALAGLVRERLQGLVSDGVRRRRSIFFR